MSTNRAGRPVTHGANWLAVRLEKNRIEPRIRRLINRLQRELTTAPFETVKGLTLGRLARRELLIQQREAHLLADSNAEGGQWLVALWNAQRRDTELLVVLDKIPDPADRLPDLDQYLRSKSGTPAAQPAARGLCTSANNGPAESGPPAAERIAMSEQHRDQEPTPATSPCAVAAPAVHAEGTVDSATAARSAVPSPPSEPTA